MATTHPVAPGARELTAEEADARAKAMFALVEDIKAGLRAGREAMWVVAKGLHEFDEQSGWTALGYEKLGEWLADPDIGMTRSTFYRLVQVYRELVVRRQVSTEHLATLDVSKVQIVLPSVKSGTASLDDALDDVQALGAKDLREKYMRTPDPADAAHAPGDDILRDEVHRPDAPINDGSEAPVFASDVDVIDAVATDVEPEGAQNTHDEGSGQVSSPIAYAEDDDGVVLTREDFLLIYQAVQGWENKARLTPCPRKDARATMKKLKAIIAGWR
jgi:hypothetical protein